MISNVLANNGGAMQPMLSGFDIVPDSSAPHLSISDANGNTTVSRISANAIMQFSAIGWYMDNAVTWSISPQVGSISENGLYTAPTTPQVATITVTATSTSDSTQTVSMTLNLVEGSLNIVAATNPVVRSMTDQFAANLNGAAYSNVIWSASLGTIDPKTGVYTAPDPLSANTMATITATSTDDPTLTATFTLALLANINPIRINSGDWYEAATDANGNIWSTDWGADGGATNHVTPFVMTGQETDGQPLTGSSPMAPIYNSARYSAYTARNSFNYNFGLPNGSYQVTLLFGNWGQPHTVLLNVTANGTQVISNYDPDAAGADVASSQTFSVVVTNKTLTLNFAGINGLFAEVSGIQIVATN
jgi:hypothetical protein